MTLQFFKGELSAYIKKLETFYELSGVTLATRNQKNINILTSYPSEWMHHYINQGYDQIDPVHLSGFGSNSEHIGWGEYFKDKPLCNQQINLLEEAKHHHILSGISFPITSPHHTQLVSLAFPYSETVTLNLSKQLHEELKSHAHILPIVMHIKRVKQAAFLHNDILAFAARHIGLSQEIHMINHEINNLLITLNDYLSHLPTHFRAEAKYILDAFQTNTPSSERNQSPSVARKSFTQTISIDVNTPIKGRKFSDT